MSALRKQEPFPTTDLATEKRASTGLATTDEMGEATIEPGIRRPPQSVATPVIDDTGDSTLDDIAPGDTYDGEIVSATMDSAEAQRTPKLNYAPTDPLGQTPPVLSDTARMNQNMKQQAAAPQAAVSQTGPENTPLFDEEELRDLRARWDQVQTSFVDEPRHAVQQADALVGTVVKRIADQFSDERAKLEKQGGRNVSTEDLRQNFKRYRAFFDRLLGF